MKVLIVRPDAPFPAVGNDGVGRAIEAIMHGFSKTPDVEVFLYNKHEGTQLTSDKYHLITNVDWSTAYKQYDIINFHTGPEIPQLSYNKRFVRTLHWVVVGDSTAKLMRDGRHTVVGVSKACVDKYNLPSTYVYSALHMTDSQIELVRRNINNKEQYFVWLGGTDWFAQKGLDVAIQMSNVLGIHLRIYGSGQNRTIIDFIKSKCNHKITYHGQTSSDDEKYEILSKSQGLIYPTLIEDGCPMTVAEALCCGCPVFAYNHSSLPELVTNGVNGFLSPVNDKMSIMKLVATNKRMQWNYLDVHNKALEFFSPERAANKYADIYKKILIK